MRSVDIKNLAALQAPMKTTKPNQIRELTGSEDFLVALFQYWKARLE